MFQSSTFLEEVLQCVFPALFLVGFLILQRKRQSEHRGLSLAAVLCLAAILTDLAEIAMVASENVSLRVPVLVTHTLQLLIFEAAFPVYLLFLLRATGRQQLAVKYRVAVWAPVLIFGVLLAVNLFTGFLFTINKVLLFPEKQSCYFLVWIVPAVLGLLCLPLMWRINWVLAVAMVIMAVTRFTLLSFLTSLGVNALMASLILILTIISLRQHSILFEIGTHLSLLSMLLLLLTVSYITNTAISSNLLSARNEAILNTRDFVSKLGSYKSLPWLVEYWEAHPDEMLNPGEEDYRYYQSGSESYGDYYTVVTDLVMTHPSEFSSYSREDVEALSPLFQYAYARSVYEYVKYNADNIQDKTGISILTLMRPTTDGYVFLADGQDPGIFTFKPGDFIPAWVMEEEWTNFNEATADSGVRWGRLAYSSDDRFGFYQEVRYGTGGSEVILCCHSIPTDYVDTAVKNISGSRNRLLLVVILLMIFVLFMLFRTAVSPLRKIDRSIKGYIQDKDAEKVRLAMNEVRSRDEIGYLAGEFSDLTHEIEVHIGEVSRLAGERERLNAELSLAANIQQAALSVDFPDCPRYSLRASMKAAKVVGGDFYDFFLIDDDHLAMVIADVSGKGVPAALFMMSAKIMINDRAEAGGTPAEILGAVNAKLCRNNTSNMFVTVWMGILEISTGILTHANAGHEYPMVREPDGRFHTIKDRHGMVLGGIDIARYRDYTLTLNPGDAIFVYTDGIPEANNPAQEFYDISRLEKALNSAPAGAAPKEILDTVDRDVTAFVDGAEQFDDMTMLCLVYHG